MTVQHKGNQDYIGLSSDTKPTPTLTAVNAIFTETDTNDKYVNNGTAWVKILGGGGGGFAAGGSSTKSGNGTTTTFTIPHGLSPQPDVYFALPTNAAARGDMSYSVDATNITLTYPVAPAPGTNNLTYVWGAGYANTAVPGLTASSTTTFTNKTIDNDLNDIKLPLYSAIVYKSGSTYKTKNMVTGLTDAITSTTDASVVINAAIASMAALTEGGAIWIRKGVYTCLSEITMVDTVAGNQGVQLIGESKDECKLNFTPASALTNAIRFKMHHAQMRSINVTANANVTNIIRIDGNGQHGIIDACHIQGATSVPTAGQIGIMDDAVTASATYYWRFLNTQFVNCDLGIKCINGTFPTNAAYFQNLNFVNTNVGIDLFSNMHMVNNIFMQGSGTLGDACVRVNGSSCFNCMISNIGADSMSKAGAGVLVLTSGALNNCCNNVTNTGSAQQILDNSGQKNYLRVGGVKNLATQTPGASPYTYTNSLGYPEEVTVGGGTVTQILFIRSPDTSGLSTGLTSGIFMLEPGDGLKITYSVAPTMLRVPH